jgi:magnesium transporter
VFLPVIASQARSSGSQAMAITIRAFTTGEWDNMLVRRVVRKEMFLGVLNGLPVAILVGVLIYFQAQGFAHPGWLGALNSFSLLAGCAASGAFGVLVPLFIKRLGSDPAMASNILFTTLASVFCQAICLSLVRWVLL